MLKKFVWPPLTQWHGWVRERSSIQKMCIVGHPTVYDIYTYVGVGIFNGDNFSWVILETAEVL